MTRISTRIVALGLVAAPWAVEALVANLGRGQARDQARRARVRRALAQVHHVDLTVCGPLVGRQRQRVHPHPLARRLGHVARALHGVRTRGVRVREHQVGALVGQREGQLHGLAVGFESGGVAVASAARLGLGVPSAGEHQERRCAEHERVLQQRLLELQKAAQQAAAAADEARERRRR